MARETDARAATTRPLGAIVPVVVGLTAAVYLTIEHVTAPLTSACPESATIDCQKLTTSSYAHLLGVPVALGVVSVLHLVWAELFGIDAIYIWCTVVHVSTVWMFGAVLWSVTGRSAE